VNGARATVLVVDDDRVNRMLLVRRLEQEGYRVSTAENGREGWERLKQEPVDIVLLDVLMPEMDGYEVLERIQADEELRHLAVIMISALDQLDSAVRCIELGADDYLPKPFDPVLLRARINAGLTRKRLADLQREYLEQVGHVVDAAGAVEEGSFELSSLDGVANREDALGQLARVFQRMASQVAVRERALKAEVQQLRIEIDEARAARQVAEITDTDYFRELERKVEELRQR
jgi:DNA-binding response OmpR family regulator